MCPFTPSRQQAVQGDDGEDLVFCIVALVFSQAFFRIYGANNKEFSMRRLFSMIVVCFVLASCTSPSFGEEPRLAVGRGTRIWTGDYEVPASHIHLSVTKEGGYSGKYPGKGEMMVKFATTLPADHWLGVTKKFLASQGLEVVGTEHDELDKIAVYVVPKEGGNEVKKILTLIDIRVKGQPPFTTIIVPSDVGMDESKIVVKGGKVTKKNLRLLLDCAE